MKKFLTIALTLLSFSAFSQKIGTSFGVLSLKDSLTTTASVFVEEFSTEKINLRVGVNVLSQKGLFIQTVLNFKNSKIITGFGVNEINKTEQFNFNIGIEIKIENNYNFQFLSNFYDENKKNLSKKFSFSLLKLF